MIIVQIVVYQTFIYTVQMSGNDLLKMDAPFWGGVDISVNAHAYAYVHLESRSFFHVILSCMIESTLFNCDSIPHNVV